MKAIIFGLGSIGMRHARILKALGVQQLVGVDPSDLRRKRFNEEVGGDAFAESGFEDLRGYALAVIASPSRFHVEQAILCAEAGCALFIEKPLATDKAGVSRLVKLVKEAHLFAHVGSNWKFHPAFIRMKELLTSGRLGRISGCQVLAGQWLPDWHPWEDYRHGYSARVDLGGGIVLDTHELDYMTWLFGNACEIKGFTAHSGSLDIETEDVACACIRFDSGVLATLHVDYIQRSYQRRYHISGDEGSVTWDVRSNELQLYRADSGETSVEYMAEDLNAMYVRQMQHVLAGIKGKVAPVTPITHAAKVLNLQLRLKNER